MCSVCECTDVDVNNSSVVLEAAMLNEGCTLAHELCVFGWGNWLKSVLLSL